MGYRELEKGILYIGTGAILGFVGYGWTKLFFASMDQIGRDASAIFIPIVGIQSFAWAVAIGEK